MDCQRCTSVLDDPERGLSEAASWGSMDDCCRETLELAKLELGLRRLMPVEQPAPDLDASILLAASRRASAVGVAHPASGMAARAPLPTIGTSGTSWISRLRHWVTAPQVAMATVTALAVVIGVFYVPSQRMVMEADGDTVMSVPRAAPVGGAPGASAPFGTGLPPKPDGLGTASSALPTGLRPATTEPQQERATAPSPASDALAFGASGELVDEDEPAAVAGLGRAGESNLAMNDAPARRADEGLAEAEESRDRVAHEVRQEAYPGAPPASTRMASRSADPTATAATATTTTASAGARSATLTAMTAVAAPTAPAAPATASGAGPAGTAGVPPVAGPELLAQARALRARGQCGAAVPLYDRYLAESGAGARGDATIELAQCLVATGHTTRARQLYERAASMPPVASRARAGLDAMGTGGTGSTGGVAAGSATPRTSGAGAATSPTTGAPTSRARAGAAATEASPGDSRIQLDAY